MKRALLVKASECGQEAHGLAEMVQPCNSNVPCFQNVSCTFQNWTAWSKCTSETSDPCSGLTKRSREFSPKVGNGALCTGSLEEAESCMPAGMEAKCNKPAPVDCELAPWIPWTSCDAVCGGGQSRRSRVRAKGEPQGKPCKGVMQEVKACNTQFCAGMKDCTYSDWIEWGTCSACGGQRSRQRHIKDYPQGGGQACKAAEMEETEGCSRDCAHFYCGWQDWRPWSDCNKKCGEGKRSRTRLLGLVSAPVVTAARERLFEMDESALEDRVQELYRRSKTAEASRRGELLFAFGLGMFALLAFVAIGARHKRSTTVSREMPMPQSPLMGSCPLESLSSRHVTDVTLSRTGLDLDAAVNGEFEMPAWSTLNSAPRPSDLRGASMRGVEYSRVEDDSALM